MESHRTSVTLHDKTFRPFLLEADIREAVVRVAQQVNQHYFGQAPLFLSVLNGSFMFTSDLLKHIQVPCEVSFVKMASYHGTSSSGQVKHLIGLDESIAGRHIVVVEDIVDTGLTIEHLFNLLEPMQPASIEVATLLFKPAAYRGARSIKFVGLEVGNEFLVGYGLDYNGRGRNLPDLYVVNS